MPGNPRDWTSIPGAEKFIREFDNNRRFRWFRTEKCWHLYAFSVKFPIVDVKPYYRIHEYAFCGSSRANVKFMDNPRGPGTPPRDEQCRFCRKEYLRVKRANMKRTPKKPKVDDDPDSWYNLT